MSLSPRPRAPGTTDAGASGLEAALEAQVARGAGTLGVVLDWAALEPGPLTVNEEALTSCSEFLTTTRRAGLEPLVVLQEDNPRWLGEEFWLMPGAPDRFAEYAEMVVSRLTGACRYWVTIVSPGRFARLGWVTGRRPPARFGALSDGFVVLDNLVTGHLLAQRAIRRVQGDAVVAVAQHASDAYDEGPIAVDLSRATKSAVAREELDAWIARRRREYHVVHPPARAADRAVRSLSALTSPFGRGLLRRPCPRRALRELAAGPPPGLDAVVVVWDAPMQASAMQEWCRVEAARLGLPLWVGARSGKGSEDCGPALGISAIFQELRGTRVA